MTSSGVPAQTIFPPAEPPSGPMSRTQSAVLMTSRLCSMTRTLLPPCTKPCSTLSSFCTSSKCRPVVGSSSTYRVRPVERRRRLPQLHVVHPDVVQRLQHGADLRHVDEVLQRLLNVHLQHVVNVLRLV